MGEIVLRIEKIKNIKSCEISLPIDKGIYCIVGANGSGKSTIMRALAQSIFLQVYKNLTMKTFRRNPSFHLRSITKELYGNIIVQELNG